MLNIDMQTKNIKAFEIVDFKGFLVEVKGFELPIP